MLFTTLRTLHLCGTFFSLPQRRKTRQENSKKSADFDIFEIALTKIILLMVSQG